MQRSQEVVRNRLLLRNYTQASLGANYDYNLRSEKVGAVQHGSEQGRVLAECFAAQRLILGAGPGVLCAVHAASGTGLAC